MKLGFHTVVYIKGSDQIRSVAQSCPTLCDPMNRSTPGLPVHYQLPEFTETHIHRVSDAIQPSHPLSSPSPLALNPSQHQSLFQWVNSSHEVAKVMELGESSQLVLTAAGHLCRLNVRAPLPLLAAALPAWVVVHWISTARSFAFS